MLVSNPAWSFWKKSSSKYQNSQTFVGSFSFDRKQLFQVCCSVSLLPGEWTNTYLSLVRVRLWHCFKSGLVHPTPGEIEGIPLKTHLILFFHTRLSGRHRFRKAWFSKYFPSTLKAAVRRAFSKKAQYLWRTSVGGSPNGKNQAVFSSESLRQRVDWAWESVETFIYTNVQRCLVFKGKP